jgi:hypothetical protein
MILGLIPFGIILGLVGLIAGLARLVTMSGRAIKFASLPWLRRLSTKQR